MRSACGMSRSHSARGNFGSQAGCKPGAEMVLPGLDGTLGGVAAVDMGWQELEIYRVFGEGLFHNVGAFVVQNV